MSRRDLMITAEILPGAEPTITVNGFGRINEVKAETKSKGGELVPVRLLKNKRTGEERYEYFDETEATFEAWKDDGIQELVPYLEDGSEEVQWRDAEDNETTRETMARWGEAAADYGEAVASQAGRLVTQIPKMIVGLAQVTNAGLGWISSWGGLNPNPVSNQFHEWAKDTAHLRQGLDRFDEKYLSADKKYDHLMSDGVRTTRDVIEGVTNLGAQLLIGGAVTKGAQAVNTAATTVKGVAPVAKVVAPTTLTKGQMVVEAGKKIFTGPGSHYALGMAGEAAGETHAAAIENGVDPNKAAVTAGVDFLTSLILNRADVESGAISAVAGPAAGQTVKQWFLGGLMRPFKSDVAKRVVRNVAWEGGSEALDQWMHLSRLQDVGVEISQDDKVRATAQAGLYGALGGALGEVGGAIEARSELKKWRRLFAIEHQAEAVEALKRAAAGQPVATDAPGGPAVVTEKGSVLFKDGAEVHGDGTITTVNGVVTDTEGQPITVVPESTDSATVDLFRLIRESDLQVQNVPVDSLKVNDQIVQFKQDADPNTGVVEGERLQGAFNPIPAKPILVMEFADGSREVVTGRHRLDLAKQNNMKAIPANIIYEKDGWTVDAARLMDAYDNILDGKGSDQDFVDFFRNAKLDNRAIQEHPELWSRKRQKEALVVAKGASEDLYTFFMAKDDRLNLETAAAIVSGAPRQKGEQNVKIQRAVLKAVLDNGLRANDAALMTRSLAHAYSQRLEAKGIQQLDLFGEDDTVIMAMGLEAKYAQRKINEINTDLRALKTLLGKQGGNLQARDALLQKYGLESSEDIQGIQNTITKLDGEVNRWKNYFTDPVLAKQAQAYAREVLHLENPVIEVDGEITTVDDRILETAPEVESTYEDPNQEGFDFAMTNDLGVTEAQRQYDEVEARFTCSDGSKDPTTWMRAPNGQPTKLSERQWIHVRTPYFKQRFGDWENDPAKATKILDENGEPRVMYHGSPAKFTIFSSKKMGSTGTSRGKGFYFSPSKEFASGYVDKGGKLYEVFLDIRKPLAYDHRTMSRAQIAKLLDALDRKLEALNGPDMGVLMDFGDVHVEGRRNVLNQAAELLDGGNDSDVDVFSELVNITGDYNTVAAVTYEVLGYDGIIPTDTDLEVIALTPAQIKSATDNVGTYSSADDDINYSVIMGEKGAANLAPEMQVMEGLVMAKQMLGNRDWAKLNAAEKDKIRLASGWEVGADGKWRFEWKDFELVSDWPKRADGTLGELLAGEGAADLFTAYPQLREINVRFETLPSGKSGYFNPRENRIAINITQIEGDSEAIRKNLTHEIQHAIQKIEGFASGGNVASEEMNHMAKLFNDAMDRKKAGEDVSSWVLDQYYHEYLLARKKAYEDYRRIAGEVEARNAATRRFGAKSYFSLEDTEGIDRRQQIIKNDINYSEMVDNNKKSGRLNAYFAMADGATTIPLTMLRPGKVEKESSIQNAQRFMREAANGLREKRQPIDVVQNEDDTYTIVDGNATAHALSRLGEDAACVRIIGKNRGSRLENSSLKIKPLQSDNAFNGGCDGLSTEEAIAHVYAMAAENAPRLKNVLNAVAKKIGCNLLMRAGLKDRTRATEKIMIDYRGDASKCVDITGGTLELSDEHGFDDALKAIKVNLPQGAEIVRVKKLNFKDGNNGYRDIKLSIRFANGGIGEVILVSKRISEIKNGIGHRVYEMTRALDQFKDESEEIKTAIDCLKELSNAIYSAQSIDEASFASIKERASSSLTRLAPSHQRSSISLEVRDLAKSLSSELQAISPTSFTSSKATPNLSLIKNAIKTSNDNNLTIEEKHSSSGEKSQEVIIDLLDVDEQNLKRNDNSPDDTNASRGRFDYASTMDISMYGNNGRVPVAGSPARERGVLPLSLHHVVEMYRLLTGKLPRVVANRSHGMASALGWFNNKTQDIMVRAQLFGLVDKTDISLLHDRLVQKGYFRNEDPAWVAANKGKVNQKQSLVDFERNKSEQALAAEVDKLVEQRIKSGIHQGIGTKVMAHELWHLIDLIDGEAVNRCKERGNLIGHIASLKGHFEKVFAEIPMASNKALTDECLEFISAWQGSPDVSYFQNKPEEIYAEMGSALMLDPERVRRSAPNFYNAMLDTMARKPKVLDIWTATMDQMRLGVDGDALIARLQKTWTREAEIAHRQVRDAITKPTWHMHWMNTVRVFFDRYKPLIMVVQKAQADVRAKLKSDLKEGVITQSDYEASIARLDKQMLDTRYAKAMYSHQYGRSKLYLADLNEKVAKEAEKRDVNMETLATYLHLKRVIELKGRATALGIDAPTARHKLNELASQLGFVKFKQVATMANIFRSLYEQHVLSNPDVRQMFGEKIMGYLDKNKHYVTMSHTVDAETVEATARRLKGEAPAIDPLEVALQDVRSLATGGDRGGIGNVLHRLEGSFRPTVNPIGATAQTAVTLLETAQQNATIIQVVDALLANNSPDVKILGTGDSRVENARFGNITFMRNGERVTARVPRVLADAINQRGANVPVITLASRFMNSAFTTNNFAFAITAYQRDLDALAINNKGLHRSPLYWLTALNLSAIIPRKGALLTTLHHALDVQAYVSAAAQWIPPHIMKSISENPVGRLIFNRRVAEYWTSYGNKCARIILNGSFEATLQDAAKARAAGNENKARELEYCATMARRALEDGILLTMNQLQRDDYSKSNLAQLFDKYNLRYDDPETLTPMPRNLAKQITLGVAKSPWLALNAYWKSAGYINELSSMTNKLAGYCAMHDQRSREGYDEAHRKEIALQAIDRAGDPDFSARGTIAGLLEAFCSPFWNARREGFMRGVRAFQEHPGNWTVKAMSHAMPRFISLLISSGILSGYLRELIGDPSDEELEGTAVGEMLYTLDWMKDAYRNISPYTLETFRAVPIWMSDDRRTTVSLKIPIPEEAKFIDAAFNATWNTAVDTYSPNPARDWRSLLKVMGEQFAFDTSSTGVLFNALSSVVSPYVFGTNPYETYRNAPMYSEDEFKARWTKDGAEYMLKSAGKRIWNNSPLTLITRFRKTNEPEMREEAQTLKDIFKLPGVGPILMRFASVDSEGREQTRRQLETIQDEANAVKRLKAREYFTFLSTGELDQIPDDVWADMDMIRYMMNYAKEGTLTEQEEWIKSMKRIKDPTLQKRAFDIYE